MDNEAAQEDILDEDKELVEVDIRMQVERVSNHTCDEELQVHSVEVQECSHTQEQQVTLHNDDHCDQVQGGDHCDQVQGSWDHSEVVSCGLGVGLVLCPSHPGRVWPAKYHKILYLLWRGYHILWV